MTAAEAFCPHTVCTQCVCIQCGIVSGLTVSRCNFAKITFYLIVRKDATRINQNTCQILLLSGPGFLIKFQVLLLSLWSLRYRSHSKLTLSLI